MRRAALALLAVALLAGAGCGDEESTGGESARQLLERGFATDVDSGVMTLEVEVRVEGGPGDGSFALRLEGPFRAAESATQMPDLDLDFRAEGAGREYDGRAIVTRENSWVEFEGETYEVGEELWGRVVESLEGEGSGEPRTFAETGLDPLDWVTDAAEAGKEEVAGVTTTKVTGRLDAERMLRDFNRLPGEPIPEEVGDAVDDVEFEAWIAEDDIWRRLRAETDLRVPAPAGGPGGGSVSFEMELDDPNEPVEIETPDEGRPLEELLRRLGVPPEVLLGPGFAQPAPG